MTVLGLGSSLLDNNNNNNTSHDQNVKIHTIACSGLSCCCNIVVYNRKMFV